MTTPPCPTGPSESPRVHSSRGPLALVAAGIAFALLAGVAVSCATGGKNDRSAVIAPDVPGASYVGSDTCEQCHDTITKNFAGASHARLIARGPNAVDIGCESCHGPASAHVESGGAARTIVNPDHTPGNCFTCHSHLRGEFNLPFRHPVRDGRLGCSACHDPHRGDAFRGGAASLTSAADACLSCHRLQRGPHVFEHEAVREGCTTCHTPHGSVNQKMLTQRNAILCLKCHFQQQAGPGRIAIGSIDHTTFLSRGTCWSAGCHEAVHGSQVSASLRF